MRVTKRRGQIRLRLELGEVQLLAVLLSELETLLAVDEEATPAAQRPADAGALLERLYPAAYPQDADAEREYRSLTRATLRDERVQRLVTCREQLSTDVLLPDDATGELWIKVLNDLRLSLGTRLGVTEDSAPRFDPSDPQAGPWLVYDWLTAMQDALVQALMRR